MDKTTQIKAEKAKQLSKPSKHLFVLLLPVPILVAVGIMGNIQGWIGKPEEGTKDDLGLAMTVPDAKVKDLEKVKKYGNYSVETPMNDVNGLGISFDDNSNINSKMLNGETGNSLGIASNTDKAVNNLTAEMGAKSKRGGSVASYEVNLSSQQKKNRVWENSHAQQRGLNRNVNTTIDAIYRNPLLSQEEQSGQDRMGIEERQRIQANEKLLDLLDKQIQQQGQPGTGTLVTQDRTPVS
ncbi:hypothetical protein [Salmonirosea aquatica]|uniref:Uncharacterized protein n=1 Tax=Salmonirosea aquatica TaxID=2654236 RepID=A0A7C9FSF5_9BACT|nr:hypothetical protein [Cytophagaceae bacterium SJW1-29]